MFIFTNIAYFAAAQGVFLSLVLLLIKRGNAQANRFLAVFILCLSLWIAEFSAYFTEDLFNAPHLLFSTVGLPLLFGPLLLFYAKALRGDQPLQSYSNYWHFAPFLIHSLYYLPFFIEPASFKMEALRELRNVTSPPVFTLSFYINESLKFIQLAAYLWWVGKMYRSWQHSHPTLQVFQQHWVKTLLIGLSLFALFDLSHLLSLFFFQYDYLFILARGILLFGAITVYYLGYATLRRPEIFTAITNEKNQVKPYQKSAFNADKVEAYIQQLTDKMEVEKLYLNPNLKLKDLARSIDLSTHHLSQLLNQHLEKNYFDFINEYRIKAAQEMLINPNMNHLSILGIAYEAGFKNKASFNSAFKKLTGLTPSQYKNNHHASVD